MLQAKLFIIFNQGLHLDRRMGRRFESLQEPILLRPNIPMQAGRSMRSSLLICFCRLPRGCNRNINTSMPVIPRLEPLSVGGLSFRL